MTTAAPNSNFTDRKETKNYVTPYAFGVHESLLGMRLASPSRRLAALVIDMVCVALLTTLDGLWLSFIVLAVSVWGLLKVRSQGNQVWAQMALTFVGVIAVLTIILQIVFSDVINKVPTVDNGPQKQMSLASSAPLEYVNDDFSDDYSVVISELRDEDGDVACEQDDECDENFMRALIRDIAKEGYRYSEARAIYGGTLSFLEERDRLDSSDGDMELTEVMYETIKNTKSTYVVKKDFSLVEWVNGVLTDLGLSFGWAAAYFSVLTAVWNGQTVGKKLFGTRVVRIDGAPISLWESFGRYGGYSAGLATGLMGFFQIYWDANRQGIQDKISETLVVRPGAPRHQVSVDSTQEEQAQQS